MSAAHWLGPYNNADDALNELRKSVAEIIGEDPETWPDHGNAPLAIAVTLALARRTNPAPAQEPVAVPAKKLYPAHPGALRASIAELDMWLDSSDTLDEIENQQSFGESIMLVVHELKRLLALSGSHVPPADHSEDILDMVDAPTADGGEVVAWVMNGKGENWEERDRITFDRETAKEYAKRPQWTVQPLIKALSHTPAPQPGWAVKVKQIDWRNMTYNGVEEWIGHCALSKSFTIKDEGSQPEYRFVVRPFLSDRTSFPTADEAKAAAQADYERRILSALEPSPSGWNAGAFEAGAKAMREKAATLADRLGEEHCTARYAAKKILALPLPTPPAGEG